MNVAEQNIADDKMRAEIAKLLAETKQIGVNTFLAPFATAAAVIAGAVALSKLLV